jgi:hypothetical protein
VARLNSLRKKYLPSRTLTSAAKAGAKKYASYRSGEPLRHPKTNAKSSFSASCEAAPFPRTYPRPFMKYSLITLKSLK